MEGPQLYTIEHQDTPPKSAPDHRERKLDALSVHSETKGSNEDLKMAQETLLNNNSLYESFLKSMISIDLRNGTREFIAIENLFIAKLQNLTDDEIESIIRQFNNGFKNFVTTYNGSISINPEQKRKIFENNLKNLGEMRGSIYVNGIKNVIHFLQARKKLLDASPSQEYGFYIEHGLDAYHKIDLIECVFGGEDSEQLIQEMNLIQIKSSVPDASEQAGIIAAHKDWVHSAVMDLESFEKEYSDGIPVGLSIETLAQNADEVEELLLDMCTDPEGFKPERFIDTLDLNELSNKQKAWLIVKYGKILQEKIHAAVESEILEPEQAEAIRQSLEALENRLRAKARLPKNLSSIQTINSITAVGPQIVKQETLVSNVTDKRKQKIVRVGN